jgi:DNA processing protein
VAALDADRSAWLRLLFTPEVGRAHARRLLAAFGSAPAIFAAGIDGRCAVVDAGRAKALAAEPEPWRRQCELAQAWLAKDAGRALICLGDADYPALLLQTEDPPLLLFAQGRLELLRAPAVAVVGSRKPTAQGLDHARRFAAGLSQAGWTVVSGLAAGIDGAAHEGALQGAGSTVAVVGTGLDLVYPERHAELSRRIARQGLLLSEFPLGTPPMAEHFPMRNRIIAGLARGTLVVEAALRSGSLITARLAAEAGREVFALPGSLQSAQARGCHALIKQGAALVESVDDILQALGTPQVAAPAAPRVDEAPEPGPGRSERDPVLRALGHDPASMDALQARTGWPVGELSARLLELELAGQVARLPGGLYQRRAIG